MKIKPLRLATDMRDVLRDKVLDRAIRTRNAVALRLRQARAVSRGTAIATVMTLDPAEARLLDRMVSFGAVKETPEGRHWLDERRFLDFRKEGLASVLGYLAMAGFVAAGAMAATG